MDGADKAEVHLGAHNLVAGDAEVVITTWFWNFYNHESYDSLTNQNDLGIIELPSKVPLSMQNATG